MRRILKLAGTVAAGLVVTAVGSLIDRNLALQLTEGNLTSMDYATRIIQFPLGIVGLAVSFAILPTLSRFTDGGRTASTSTATRSCSASSSCCC